MLKYRAICQINLQIQDLRKISLKPSFLLPRGDAKAVSEAMPKALRVLLPRGEASANVPSPKGRG
ncbi:hypothetical protein A2T98_20155 [Nodularia spumigena CENA596]|uniref:Uncharacterized protein n=1 Tax=Nodularia spumigena CENA596 TaxID=1819295 RepID=A0A166I6U0_NODSP|nr:hypothetical protein A2T98_20155 [Nodularia spumigena CENA596]